MSWCFQCGVASRPSKAVGVDEDGEPACSGHQVKEIGAGLNAAAASRTAVSAPIGFGKKFEAAQIKPAAPSPVQIKQESTMERTCKCGCGGTVPATNRFSYINGHRTRKVTPGTPRRRKVAKLVDAPEVAPLALSGSGSAEQHFGVNHFTAGQLDRFWSLLSPVSKAEAIDRLLSYQAL